MLSGASILSTNWITAVGRFLFKGQGGTGERHARGEQWTITEFTGHSFWRIRVAATMAGDSVFSFHSISA